VALVERRSDGSVQVFMDKLNGFILPRDLGELFIVLASHDRTGARGSGGSDTFKSSQFLGHELGRLLGRIVRRRDLRRAIARLRRALGRQRPIGRSLIEGRHGAGWRLAVTQA
jgi:hypothetical protein